jgi:hypothetical protein
VPEVQFSISSQRTYSGGSYQGPARAASIATIPGQYRTQNNDGKTIAFATPPSQNDLT